MIIQQRRFKCVERHEDDHVPRADKRSGDRLMYLFEIKVSALALQTGKNKNSSKLTYNPAPIRKKGWDGKDIWRALELKTQAFRLPPRCK
jgi:hypothetical protein